MNAGRTDTQQFPKTRTVLMALVGVAGLLLKGSYSGPLRESVHNYVGNVSVSFAVYFVVSNLPFPAGHRRLFAALVALAVVEGFEVSNGYGVMSNVYDPLDLLANGAGIAIAVLVDVLLQPRPGRGTVA
jgi:hypothetical protein